MACLNAFVFASSWIQQVPTHSSLWLSYSEANRGKPRSGPEPSVLLGSGAEVDLPAGCQAWAREPPVGNLDN